MVKVGDAITYFDEHCKERNALVTAVHNPDYINLVVITNDPSMQDQYGQQLCRVSSVSKLGEHNKAGRYFVEK